MLNKTQGPEEERIEAEAWRALQQYSEGFQDPSDVLSGDVGGQRWTSKSFQDDDQPSDKGVSTQRR
jgi:hypothetical protein